MADPGELERRDARLLAIVDRTLDEANRRAGAHLACRVGCSECCIGPFPINAADALRLRRGLATLAPGKAAAIRARARATVAVLAEDWLHLGDEAFYAKHADLPCPALDPATGACEVYAHRPIPCRTFGPAVRIGAEDLAPCRLCFTTASAEEVEQARVTLDTAGLEEEQLDQLGSSEDTLIAIVLARS
jgi:Fe-S-cluster containining protein